MSDDLTLEAGSKKVVVKAADNVEIEARKLAVMRGSDVKLSKTS